MKTIKFKTKESEARVPVPISLLQEIKEKDDVVDNHEPGGHKHDQKKHGRRKGSSLLKSKEVIEALEEDEDGAEDWIADRDLFDQMALHLTPDDVAKLVRAAIDDPGDILVAGFEVHEDTIDYDGELNDIFSLQESKLGIGRNGPLAPGEEMADGGHYEPEEMPDMDEFMKNHYPQTDEWHEGIGFLMADGSKLDMSYGSGSRADDHRSINPTDEAAERWGYTEDELNNRSTVLFATLKRARAMRVHVGDSTRIDVETSPTSAQRSAIRELIRDGIASSVYVDVTKRDGSTASSSWGDVAYTDDEHINRISADAIVNFIDDAYLTENWGNDLSTWNHTPGGQDHDQSKHGNRQSDNKIYHIRPKRFGKPDLDAEEISFSVHKKASDNLVTAINRMNSFKSFDEVDEWYESKGNDLTMMAKIRASIERDLESGPKRKSLIEAKERNALPAALYLSYQAELGKVVGIPHGQFLYYDLASKFMGDTPVQYTFITDNPETLELKERISEDAIEAEVKLSSSQAKQLKLLTVNHKGPGDHPSGSSQDVHGKKGKGFGERPDVSEEVDKLKKKRDKTKELADAARKTALAYSDEQQEVYEKFIDDGGTSEEWMESEQRLKIRDKTNELWREVSKHEELADSLDKEMLTLPIKSIPSRDDFVNAKGFLNGLSYEDAQEQLGEAEVDRLFEENRKKRKEWDARIDYELAMGRMTQEQAEYLGMSRSDGAKFKELPGELYHVTTAATGVRDGGLKTRDELSQDMGKGLGGGTSNTISYTGSPEIAAAIYGSMKEARAVAEGKITYEDMINAAREGRGAKKPYMERLMHMWDRDWKEGDDLPKGVQDSIDGISTHWSMLSMKHDVKQRTEAQKNDDRFEFFKRFGFVREQEGGHMDPLFFLTDVEGLGDINPEEIQIVKVKPIKGAQGTQLHSLGEWRSTTGDNVEIVDIYKPEEITDRLVKNLMAGVCNHTPGGHEHDQKKHGNRQKQTESEAFKKWFGDSKVVTEDGSPLVVYHGTSKDFSTFGRVFRRSDETDLNQIGWHYFADNPDFAEKFAVSDIPIKDMAPGKKVKQKILQKEGEVEMDAYETKVKGLVIVPWDDGHATITHQKSGFAIASADDVDQAKDIVGELKKTRLSFDKSEEQMKKLSKTSIKRMRNAVEKGRLKASDDATAAMFGWKTGKIDIGVGSAIRPSYLKIEKPIDLRGLGTRAMNSDRVIKELKKHGIEMTVRDMPFAGRRVYQMLNDATVAEKIKKQASKLGFDGIIFKDYYDAKLKAESYIVFDPTHIKSATGNKGTFDPDDPVTTNDFWEEEPTWNHTPGGHQHDQKKHGHKKQQPKTARDVADLVGVKAKTWDEIWAPGIWFRVQPKNKQLNHRSINSDDSLTEGLHVVQNLEQVIFLEGKWSYIDGNHEVIVVSGPERLKDTGDVEGSILPLGKGKIIGRIDYESLIMEYEESDSSSKGTLVGNHTPGSPPQEHDQKKHGKKVHRNVFPSKLHPGRYRVGNSARAVDLDTANLAAKIGDAFGYSHMQDYAIDIAIATQREVDAGRRLLLKFSKEFLTSSNMEFFDNEEAADLWEMVQEDFETAVKNLVKNHTPGSPPQEHDQKKHGHRGEAIRKWFNDQKKRDHRSKAIKDVVEELDYYKDRIYIAGKRLSTKYLGVATGVIDGNVPIFFDDWDDEHVDFLRDLHGESYDQDSSGMDYDDVIDWGVNERGLITFRGPQEGAYPGEDRWWFRVNKLDESTVNSLWEFSSQLPEDMKNTHVKIDIQPSGVYTRYESEELNSLQDRDLARLFKKYVRNEKKKDFWSDEPTWNHTPGGHDHDQKKHGKRSGEKPVIFSAVYLDEKAKAELLDRVKPEHPNIIAHHMTIEFRPKSIDHLNLDEEVTLKIVGVAHDERGQAVLVESPIDSNNKHPHITISIAEGQVPKVSNEILETAPVDMFDEPFEIRGRVGVTREGEPTRTNSLTAQVPQILKDAGYKIDNPGGEWLEHEKKRAREKNVRGSVTALTQSLPVSVDELINLPGQNQEELRMDSDLSKKKIKELAASIKEKGLEHGPLVWVDVNGRATIAEGNHRIRAAKKLGMKTMPIQFRWFAGSETSNSLWGAKQVAERANKLTRNSCPVSRKVCPVANHKGPGPHPSGSSQDVHGKKGPVKSDEPEHHLAATWHLLSQKLTGITDRKLKSGKEAAPTVTEFAKYLQELHGKEIKTTTGKLSESDIEWISEALAEDILHSYAKADSGVGWYTKDVDEMWQKMSTEYPKLKDDENHKFIFTAAIAILSNGQDVDLNLRDAASLYERWTETGKITTQHKFGHQTSDVYKSFNVIQALLDSNLGVDGTRELLNRKETVKEIEQLGYDLLPDLTLPGKTPTSKLISPLLVDGELRNKEKVPVFSVFGSKIGSFYNNIKGDPTTLTMDRWFMRSFGRTTGELMTPGYLIEKRAQSIVELIDGTFKDKKGKTHRMADSELEGFTRDELRSEFKRIAETGDFGFSDKGYQWAHNRERAYANSKSKTGKGFADKTKANLAANGMKKSLMEIHMGAPANKTHRRNIRQVMNRVLSKVEDRTGRKANIAEIQAVLWNHEKDLYRSAKVRSRKNINLSTAADMFINGDTERIVLTNAASFVYPNEMGNDSQALHDEWFSQIDVNQLVKELIARFS